LSLLGGETRSYYTLKTSGVNPQYIAPYARLVPLITNMLPIKKRTPGETGDPLTLSIPFLLGY